MSFRNIYQHVKVVSKLGQHVVSANIYRYRVWYVVNTTWPCLRTRHFV